VQDLLNWLSGLPPVALYAALALVSAAENVFPPLPADTVVAFGAFLAAQGRATLLGAFLSTWLGNITGALFIYVLGRRYGAQYAHRWMSRFGGAGRESQLQAMYERRGILALFLSRFIPGLRALVPPFAGALHVPPGRATLAIAVASGIWYGIVTWIAYRVGSDWEVLQERLRGAGLTAATVALVLAVLAILWFLMRRRRAPQ
jgi:membrane protein DedA with SNARE-associated domain